MIDLHTHSLISDGALVPSELARRAAVAGYKGLAITDHADESNIELVLSQIIKVCRQLNKDKGGLKVIPGVELTHIPVRYIPLMVKKARRLGAKLVVAHGETIVEPVAPGTNAAFIRSGVDVLAHPGLITNEECALALRFAVHLEISGRKGHSLSNGHVASLAKRHGVKMLINTDAHGPADLTSAKAALEIVLGAGLVKNDFKRMQDNAQRLLEKI
jgi:histidinol phosphatase-like PHP family hydrolase